MTVVCTFLFPHHHYGEFLCCWKAVPMYLPIQYNSILLIPTYFNNSFKYFLSHTYPIPIYLLRINKTNKYIIQFYQFTTEHTNLCIITTYLLIITIQFQAKRKSKVNLMMWQKVCGVESLSALSSWNPNNQLDHHINIYVLLHISIIERSISKDL